MIYISIMELRHLKYFVAVAEELHFRRAALRLHISQPPLSQQIKSLEEELGAELFIRTSRKVELTPAGHALLIRARALLSLAEAAKAEVGRVAAGLEGVLRVGFVTPAMDGPLPGVVARYRRQKPGVSLELKEASSFNQLECLRSGKLDLAFIRNHGQDMRGLASRPFMRDNYVLALPKDHPLAQHKHLDLSVLDGQPFIFFAREQGPRVHDQIMDALARAGASPVITQEVLSKRTTLALVASGLGLALVPRSSAKASGHDLAFRQVENALPQVEIDLAWSPANPSPLVGGFLENLPVLP